MASLGLNGIQNPISKAFEIYQMDIVYQVLQLQYEMKTLGLGATPRLLLREKQRRGTCAIWMLLSLS